MTLKKISDVQDLVPTNVVLDQNRVFGPMRVADLNDYSFHMVWTGTPTGSFQAQISNFATGPWQDDGGAVATGGAAGDNMFSRSDAPNGYARINYTHTSGTGTMTQGSFVGKQK